MSRLSCDVCLGSRRVAGEPCERCGGTGSIPRPDADVLSQEDLDRLERLRQRRGTRTPDDITPEPPDP